MSSRKKICPNYTGLACVNGSCPIALREEYQEYGIPVIKNCDECHKYEGCEDCAWEGTDVCVKDGELLGGGE